jgi:2'-5' RNA ligase
MSALRLFIGVDISDDVREQIVDVAERLRGRAQALKFVEPENYHLTLAFLGNVDEHRIVPIREAIENVSLRHERCSVVFDRVGAFPHERKARIIFVGSRGASREYRALAADLRDECGRASFAVDEKDDVPHVTIARAPGRKNVRLPLVEVRPIAVAIEALVLFESVPYEGKTRYEKLLRQSLQAQPRP